MDEIDTQLLAALASDASRSTTALARDLGLARSTVQARIERLKRTGVIAGYTIRLGTEISRRRIRATVLLQIEPHSTGAVLSRLKLMSEVESCATTTGRVDLILSVVAEDTERLDATLDKIGTIPGVRGSESLIQLTSKWDRHV